MIVCFEGVLAYRRKGRLLANPLFQHPDPEMMAVQVWLYARYKWFSLLAAVSIDGTNRSGLSWPDWAGFFGSKTSFVEMPFS
jgi:hypothetical protein